MDKFVERILASGVVCDSLVELRAPASISELDATELRLGKSLPVALRALLGRWNGANLDVVRFLPCEQIRYEAQGVYIANDPAGFMYFLQPSGAVASLDTDSGGVEVVASDVEDLLTSYIFGSRAYDFAGDEWFRILSRAGFVI